MPEQHPQTPPERAQRLASPRMNGSPWTWAPRIEELAAQTNEVHVLMNNCYQDYAVVNARQLGMLLR